MNPGCLDSVRMFVGSVTSLAGAGRQPLPLGRQPLPLSYRQKQNQRIVGTVLTRKRTHDVTIYYAFNV